MPAMPTEWSDDNPYFLYMESTPDWVQDEHGNTTGQTAVESNLIDLGVSGWAAVNIEWMRRPARWWLVHKAEARGVLTQMVFAGEQGYYTARHVGVVGSGGGNEITAYGIGKKRADGHTDRLWALPSGEVTGGDDVDEIGVQIVTKLGPRE